MFHKEGHLIIGVSLVIAIASVLGIDYLALAPFWLAMGLKVAVLGLLILILQFFRNPKRTAALNHNHILSPVDGKVVVIEEVLETEVLGDRRKQISIFMSPINVHVTRYPASGVVSYSKYHPGKYLVAWHPKSSTENERTTVGSKHQNLDLCYTAKSQVHWPAELSITPRKVKRPYKAKTLVLSNLDPGLTYFYPWMQWSPSS